MFLNGSSPALRRVLARRVGGYKVAGELVSPHLLEESAAQARDAIELFSYNYAKTAVFMTVPDDVEEADARDLMHEASRRSLRHAVTHYTTAVRLLNDAQRTRVGLPDVEGYFRTHAARLHPDDPQRSADYLRQLHASALDWRQL